MASKREIFGFCLFDFANSAYTTVIITTLYGVYFSRAIGSPFLWSVALALSHLCVFLASPVAGAMADSGGKKKQYLRFSTLLCVGGTALLYFCGKERLVGAMALIVLSNMGFSFSEIFVSSFLPSLSTAGNIGRISGYAWSFGYVGGIGSLLACLWYLSSAGFTDGAIRFTTVLTAGFFGVFALPSLLWMKEPDDGNRAPVPGSLLKAGFGRLAETYRDIRKYRDLFKFLISFFFYSCGTATIFSFASIFAQNVLHFSDKEILLLILVANITAAAGAFGFGFIQDMIGARKTLLITLLLWLTAVLAAYFVETKSFFWAIANLIGVAMGASQSAGRSIVGVLSPAHKRAEFYGFWGMAGKAAALTGIFSFGLLLKVTGNDMRTSLLATALFFLLGLALLYFIGEKPKDL